MIFCVADGLHFQGVTIIDHVVQDLYKYGLKEGGKLFLAGSRFVIYYYKVVGNKDKEGGGESHSRLI